MTQAESEIQSQNQNNTTFYKTISIIAMFVGFYMGALALYDLFSLCNGTDPMNIFHHFNTGSSKSTIRALAFQDISMNAPVALLMGMVYGPNLKTVFAKKTRATS